MWLSLPRAIFASNRRCKTGVQENPCPQASGTPATPAAKTGEPPRIQCWTAMPNFTQVLVRHPITIAVHLESYKEWFTGTVGFYRGCSPFNCVEQFPTLSTDRVAVILQFTWFVVGVKRSYFVSAPVPAPWQILAMLPQPHRLRSIADQPA